MTERRRFLWSWFAVAVLGLTLVAAATPPDPLSQLPGLVAAVVLATPVAYWLVYRDGFAVLGLSYRQLPLAVVAAVVLELIVRSTWELLRPRALVPAESAGLGYGANVLLSVTSLAAGLWLVASGRLTRQGFRR